MNCPNCDESLPLVDVRKRLSKKTGPRGGKRYVLEQLYECARCGYFMLFRDFHDGRGFVFITDQADAPELKAQV